MPVPKDSPTHSDLADVIAWLDDEDYSAPSGRCELDSPDGGVCRTPLSADGGCRMVNHGH